MTYELAEKQDLQEVYRIVQHTIESIYPKYYPAEVVNFFCELHSEEAIGKDIENGRLGVLKIDGKTIATGCFTENHITRVYVLPEYQNKGYGTFIIESMEAEIAELYDSVCLDASLPAAALYEKLGYRTVKHEKFLVEHGVVLAYEIMEKELKRKSRCRRPVYYYKKADIENIDELVRTRLIVLRGANKLSEEADMKLVEEESYAYYRRALSTGEHIAYLIYDKKTFIGAGGVSFYQVMPTYHNPSGRKAYIMNMYTAPQYRRQGIAYEMLNRLVRDIRARGVTQIALEATDMGRPLYEKYGFVQAGSEMELISH